jgi:hypothetical protein
MRAFITTLSLAALLFAGAALGATHLSWTPGTPGTGATIAHHELLLNGNVVATPAAGATSYTYSNCAKLGDLWTIRVVDSNGAVSALSDPPTVQPRDECVAVALVAPAGLKLTVDNPRITVSWQAVPGAVSYQVILDGNIMATVKGLQSVRTVQVGKCITRLNQYSVRAVGADGSKSPVAGPVSVTTNVCNVSCP